MVKRNLYLHIGGEYTLLCSLIVGIFNLEDIKQNQKDMIQFLSGMEKKDFVEYVSDEVPRSFVMTSERIYFSPISAVTLQKRLKGEDFMNYR